MFKKRHIMKKTYINPTTTVVNVKLQQIIASSPGSVTLAIQDPTNPNNPVEPIEDPDEVGARQDKQKWDDEEDEDY